MLRCVAAILLLCSAVCSAVTLSEITQKQAEYAKTYNGRICKFATFVDGKKTLEGTLHFVDESRWLIDAVESVYEPTHRRYLFTEGVLRENMNNLVVIVPEKEMRLRMLRYTYPTNPVYIVGGSMVRTFAELFSDSGSEFRVVREVDDEIVVHLVRDGVLYAIDRFDPRNGCAIVRSEVASPAPGQKGRTVFYKDGLVTRSISTVRKPDGSGFMEMKIDYDWSGTVDPDFVRIESLMSGGEIVLEDIGQGKKSARRLVDGKLVPDPSFPVIRSRDQPVEGTEESPATVPTDPQPHVANRLCVFALVLARIGCESGLVRRGRGVVRDATLFNVARFNEFSRRDLRPLRLQTKLNDHRLKPEGLKSN